MKKEQTKEGIKGIEIPVRLSRVKQDESPLIVTLMVNYTLSLSLSLVSGLNYKWKTQIQFLINYLTMILNLKSKARIHS